MLLASLGVYKSVPCQSQVNALCVALPNGGISNKLHLHLPVPFSIDWNFVGFLNTSYKFSLLISFRVYKNQGRSREFKKPGIFRGQIFSRDMNLNPRTVPGKRGRLVTLPYSPIINYGHLGWISEIANHWNIGTHCMKHILEHYTTEVTFLADQWHSSQFVLKIKEIFGTGRIGITKYRKLVSMIFDQPQLE
jgi:hypothetical protein